MPLFTSPDPRSPLPLVAGCLLALTVAPAAAGAQAGPSPPAVNLGGAEIDLKLELPDGDGGFAEPDALTYGPEYMNLANCSCGEDALFQIEFSLKPVPTQAISNLPVEIWTGNSCAQEEVDNQESLCFEEDEIADVSDLRTQVIERQIQVRHLFPPIGGGAECERIDTQKRAVYAIIDEGRDGFGEGDYEAHWEIEADSRPPPEPRNPKARGSEESVEITWDEPDSRDEDIDYFQVLCARADATAAQPDAADEFGGIEKRYLTSLDVCGRAADGACPRAPSGAAERLAGGGSDAGPDAGSGIDAGTDGDAGPPEGECVTGLPGRLDSLDPLHLCGSVQGNTNTNVRAEGLENGVDYRIVLLIVDKARNVTAIDLGVATPEPAIDFWEDYKNSGGRAKGGCSAGQAGLGGLGLALVVVAIVGFGFRSVRRRRRRTGGIAGGAAILLLALSPRVASAQPWWEGYDEPVQEQAGPAQPNWGLEIKLGPYFPDVDQEFGDGEGPFERMFGDGPLLMSQITLDRYFLYPLGQLGLSASLGFLTRSANAFKTNEDGSRSEDRSVGDKTVFRLFPASLGVVYRFTQLDDQLRIPVVPYGRVGLSYYYWWVTKPSGGTAEAPTDDCPDLMGCEGEPGRGGSLGWQATAGLAVRIERIDPDAEVSLRTELGIEHAGLIFEFTYAKVDGFGSSEKMSVGDATWFGGINFEF
jgi:hypothetical protein